MSFKKKYSAAGGPTLYTEASWSINGLLAEPAGALTRHFTNSAQWVMFLFTSYVAVRTDRIVLTTFILTLFCSTSARGGLSHFQRGRAMAIASRKTAGRTHDSNHGHHQARRTRRRNFSIQGQVSRFHRTCPKLTPMRDTLPERFLRVSRASR